MIPADPRQGSPRTSIRSVGADVHSATTWPHGVKHGAYAVTCDRACDTANHVACDAARCRAGRSVGSASVGSSATTTSYKLSSSSRGAGASR
jgi:hypothetical protein